MRSRGSPSLPRRSTTSSGSGESSPTSAATCARASFRTGSVMTAATRAKIAATKKGKKHGRSLREHATGSTGPRTAQARHAARTCSRRASSGAAEARALQARPRVHCGEHDHRAQRQTPVSRLQATRLVRAPREDLRPRRQAGRHSCGIPRRHRSDRGGHLAAANERRQVPPMLKWQEEMRHA